jgi:flagellar biosynthesis GTPase FlhF
MIIQEIIAIAGKPGLYRILTTGRNSLVVQSMTDGKRMSIAATSRVSSLGDITMYTTGEDIHLRDVLHRIHDHTGGKEGVSHKASPAEIREFVDGIIPELDHDRVYNSDLKKLIQWYNTLAQHNAFPLESQHEIEEAEEQAAAEAAAAEAKAAEAKQAPEKKPAAKKPAVKKAAPKKEASEEKPAAKKPAAKKPAAKKAAPKKTDDAK